MELGLKGKKAIITGGSRGIGRATAELLASEGCDIAFFSRNAAQVEEQKKALAAKGVKVHAGSVDITDAAAYGAWLKQAADALGGCDIFIHNASNSGSPGGTVDWQKCFEIDMLGAVRGVEALTPYLEKSSAGSVVLISSTAATETFFIPQAFNAVKASMVTYGKQLSQFLGPKKIRVNCVSPGPIYFEGGNWQGIEKAAKAVYDAEVAKIPFGRLGTVDEVARVIAFVASPAASWVTGVNLIVDGGYTKRVQL